jgi:hypothetical protein
MSEGNIWNEILERLKPELDPDDYRRWFVPSTYASDSGDIISVWIPSVADGRQIEQAYGDRLRRELVALGRPHTDIRFIATGFSDDEDEEEAGDGG